MKWIPRLKIMRSCGNGSHMENAQHARISECSLYTADQRNKVCAQANVKVEIMIQLDKKAGLVNYSQNIICMGAVFIP